MEGVRVSSYVSINSGKLHVLSRFDYVRVCVCTYVSHLPSASSRHLPSLCVAGSASAQVRVRRHAYGRERVMHTHKERGGEEE